MIAGTGESSRLSRLGRVNNIILNIIYSRFSYTCAYNNYIFENNFR